MLARVWKSNPHTNKLRME
jgi:hypothetical protein